VGRQAGFVDKAESSIKLCLMAEFYYITMPSNINMAAN